MSYLTQERKINKLQNDCLKQSIGKDQTRAALCDTVCHAESIKKLVSCDGHTATLLASRYDERLAGLSINVKSFQTEPLKFPDVSSFDISEVYQDKNSAEVTIEEKYCTKGKTLTKVFLIFDAHTDNSVTTPPIIKLSFDRPLDSDYVACIDSRYLMPLKGHCIKVFFGKLTPKMEPITFCLDTDKMASWYVVMTLRL